MKNLHKTLSGSGFGLGLALELGLGGGGGGGWGAIFLEPCCSRFIVNQFFLLQQVWFEYTEIIYVLS